MAICNGNTFGILYYNTDDDIRIGYAACLGVIVYMKPYKYEKHILNEN